MTIDKWQINRHFNQLAIEEAGQEIGDQILTPRWDN